MLLLSQRDTLLMFGGRVMVERSLQKVLVERKILWFERKTSASVPVFNIIEPDGNAFDRGVFLSSSGEMDGSEYRLSERQFQLLEALCSHPLSNKELASYLGISPNTVKNHLSSVFRIFDIDAGGGGSYSKVRLVAKLIEENLLTYQARVNDGDLNMNSDTS